MPDVAARIAAVPYDVVSADEARDLAEGNALSFLRVSRAEIELPPGTNPYADEVYDRAVENFRMLRATSMVVEDEPSMYFYRLRMGNHTQTGLAACFSIDEYDRNIIKKHERTRPDKEDDRTRHMKALRAQTGPVFLTYRADPGAGGVAEILEIAEHQSQTAPLFDFDAPDAVRHTIWRVGGADRDALVKAFARIPSLYIADGHHRAASAARARVLDLMPGRDRAAGQDPGFLAVAFPSDQVQILSYNRVVKDLNGLTPESFVRAVAGTFDVQPDVHRRSVPPRRPGEIAMYARGSWHTLISRVRQNRGGAAPGTPRADGGADGSDPANLIASLDVSVLQDCLLAPILGIGDVRTDKRIDFVGGGRGTRELETLVDSGKAAVAFSLFPVSVADLMAVADRGAIMPPKSTWFEPKLRDGLLIHEL